MVNLHFSLLPRWRGAAPVERAILAGDEKTGVCLMALEKTLDTGPVYARIEVTVLPEETAAELKARLSDIGAGLLVERLSGGLATLGTPVPQVGEAVYASKIDRSELRLVWERPAVDLERLVRIGRAWTIFREKRLIVERARIAGPVVGDDEGRARPARPVWPAHPFCGLPPRALSTGTRSSVAPADSSSWRYGRRAARCSPSKPGAVAHGLNPVSVWASSAPSANAPVHRVRPGCW